MGLERKALFLQMFHFKVSAHSGHGNPCQLHHLRYPNSQQLPDGDPQCVHPRQRLHGFRSGVGVFQGEQENESDG